MKKEQKFLITSDTHAVNQFLSNGWRIVSVTAQHVTSGASFITRGEFAILMEREFI
jgi:hypothetical protein